MRAFVFIVEDILGFGSHKQSWNVVAVTIDHAGWFKSAIVLVLGEEVWIIDCWAHVIRKCGDSQHKQALIDKDYFDSVVKHQLTVAHKAANITIFRLLAAAMVAEWEAAGESKYASLVKGVYLSGWGGWTACMPAQVPAGIPAENNAHESYNGVLKRDHVVPNALRQDQIFEKEGIPTILNHACGFITSYGSSVIRNIRNQKEELKKPIPREMIEKALKIKYQVGSHFMTSGQDEITFVNHKNSIFINTKGWMGTQVTLKRVLDFIAGKDQCREGQVPDVADFFRSVCAEAPRNPPPYSLPQPGTSELRIEPHPSAPQSSAPHSSAPQSSSPQSAPLNKATQSSAHVSSARQSSSAPMNSTHLNQAPHSSAPLSSSPLAEDVVGVRVSFKRLEDILTTLHEVERNMQADEMNDDEDTDFDRWWYKCDCKMFWFTGFICSHVLFAFDLDGTIKLDKMAEKWTGEIVRPGRPAKRSFIDLSTPALPQKYSKNTPVSFPKDPRLQHYGVGLVKEFVPARDAERPWKVFFPCAGAKSAANHCDYCVPDSVCRLKGGKHIFFFPMPRLSMDSMKSLFLMMIRLASPHNCSSNVACKF